MKPQSLADEGLSAMRNRLRLAPLDVGWFPAWIVPTGKSILQGSAHAQAFDCRYTFSEHPD